MNAATPPQLRTCFAHLSFSPVGVKNRLNKLPPNHEGNTGLPDVAANNPSFSRRPDGSTTRNLGTKIAARHVAPCECSAACSEARICAAINSTRYWPKR